MNNRVYIFGKPDSGRRLIPNEVFLKSLKGSVGGFGELEHPSNKIFDLGNITHKVESVKLKQIKLPRKLKKKLKKKYGDLFKYKFSKLVYDLKFLENEHGLIAKKLFDKKLVECSIGVKGVIKNVEFDENQRVNIVDDAELISVNILPNKNKC